MTLAAVLLGLINVIIVVAILLLVGAIIEWVLSMIGFPVPHQVRQLYLVIVALVALYMVVALLLGFPVVHVIHSS